MFMLIKTVISAQATGDYILNTAKEYINNIDF